MSRRTATSAAVVRTRHRALLIGAGAILAAIMTAGRPAVAFTFTSHSGTGSVFASAPQGAFDSDVDSPTSSSDPDFQATAFAHQPGSGQASAIASGLIDLSRPEALRIATLASADASLSSAFSGFSEAQGQVVDQVVTFLMPAANVELNYSLAFSSTGPAQNILISASILVENLTTSQSVLSIGAPAADTLRFGGSVGDQMRLTVNLDVLAQAPGGMAGLAAFAEAAADLSFAPIPGDANFDGMVNIADLSILASHWQQSGVSWFQGDFNGDATVNIADLSILAAHWQAGVPADAPAMSFAEAIAVFDVFNGAAIPEPAVVRLLALVLLAGQKRTGR